MKLYAIWCKDQGGDWLREQEGFRAKNDYAILVFTSKRRAQKRAAEQYGFDTYTEAKRKDWCEVKEISAIGG